MVKKKHISILVQQHKDPNASPKSPRKESPLSVHVYTSSHDISLQLLLYRYKTQLIQVYMVLKYGVDPYGLKGKVPTLKSLMRSGKL